jgi:nitrogen regulatory protein PII
MWTANRTEQEMNKGNEKEHSLFERIKLELIVSSDELEKTINTINKGAMESGGYGKLFVSNVD